MKNQFRAIIRYYAIMTLVCTIFNGCQPVSTKSGSSASKPVSTNSGNSVITAPVDYIDSAIRVGEQSKGVLALGATKKAIETFQQLEERNPNTLDELISTGYLKVIPSPPHGQEFEYNAMTGEIKLVPKK